MTNFLTEQNKDSIAKELQIQKTVSEIKQGFKVLVLMRGLPGSGKSYLAKDILKKSLDSTDYNMFICSTDDYFVDHKTGRYNFDLQKIAEAHQSNQVKAFSKMIDGISPIIIDNTNTQIWEMEPYAKAAAVFHYIIEIVEPNTKWAFEIHELVHRNSHNVPINKLVNMLNRYDKYITVEKLLGVLTYSPNAVYRSYPLVYRAPFEISSNCTNTNNSPNYNNANSTNQNHNITSGDIICISDDDEKQPTNNSAASCNKHILSIDGISLPSDLKKQGICNESTTSKQTSNNFYSQFNLASWGLTENAVSNWESWGVAKPLKSDAQLLDQIIPEEKVLSVETVDAATNTYGSDFTLLFTDASLIQCKVLKTNSRDINEGLSVSPYPSSPPKRTLLHKSSMTNDNLSIEESVIQIDDNEIVNLSLLFPNIPLEYLKDVYEKCKGDINWAVDLLLDDTREIIPVDNLITNDPNTQVKTNNLQENMEDLKISHNSPVKVESTVDQNTDETLMDLHKHVENIREITKHFYSDDILKQKNQRQTSVNLSIIKPSTSQVSEISSSVSKNIPTSAVSDSGSDADFEFFGDMHEEMIELNLGENVISQLETKLGFEELMPRGFTPIVQVPISFARQLYAIYVESILEQLDFENQILHTIVKQDEEFALKLQEQEIFLGLSISNNCQKDTGHTWKKETAESLATKMTLQKLATAFPDIKLETLTEIYQAYNNSYCETVEVLLMSTSLVYDPDGNVKEPPINKTTIKEMKDAENELNSCIIARNIPKSAQEYRSEANVNYAKHNELIQKATQAYQRKQFCVAQFYSERAKTHTQLYDQANNLAASAFMNEHSQKLQNFYTLDLHFLYVKEAVAALDMFIDKNIHLLNGRKLHENLFIITGRGKRSEQGVSKLKPAIMMRLTKRKIRYWELNPGLLKIRVLHTSLLTSNV